MSVASRIRQLLPVVVSATVIAAAVTVLARTFSHVAPRVVLAQLRATPPASIACGALLVVTVLAALALYEVIVVYQIRAAVSARRAVLAALIAAPVGHAVGWGVLSGGAVRYRIYSAAGLRPLDIGKIVVLAAMPYAAGLALLLGLALVLAAPRAALVLHVGTDLARGAGIGLLALHLFYVTLCARQRTRLPFGQLTLALPTPQLTAVQYAIGAIEVACGSALLYLMLPEEARVLHYVPFVAVYVLSILVALASMVPAGLFVFEGALVYLLPQIEPSTLFGSVLAYRFLLEALPLAAALALLVVHELVNRARRAGQ